MSNTDTKEDDDKPNAPENSNNEFENDSELEDFMNNQANDTAMELNKLLNFPNLLDFTKISQASSATYEGKVNGSEYQFHTAVIRDQGHTVQVITRDQDGYTHH